MKTKRIDTRLPQEKEGLFKLKSILTNIIGTITIVVLINFLALVYLNNYTPNRGYWLVKEKWNKLLTLKQPVNWLILGDSTGNSGVMPGIIENNLGGNGVNLCTISLMLIVNDVWMLETYIERFGKPENLIMVYSTEVWQRKLHPALVTRIPLEWGFWKRFSPQPKLGLKDKIDMFLSRYAPLYAERDSLYKSIIRGIKHPKTLFKKKFHLEQDGFMRVEKANPAAVKSHMNELINFAAKNHFAVSQINNQALEEIVALASRYKISTYIALSPIYEGLYGDESFQAYYRQVQLMLKSYADRSDYLNHIDKTVMFPHDQLYSADHVIDSGAQVYTKMLVAEISAIKKKVNRIAQADF